MDYILLSICLIHQNIQPFQLFRVSAWPRYWLHDSQLMSCPFRDCLHPQSYNALLDRLQEQQKSSSEVVKLHQAAKLLLSPASLYSKVKKICFLYLLFWFLSFASSIRKENKILTWKYTRFYILCKLVVLLWWFSLAFFYFWVLVCILTKNPPLR